MRALDVQHQRSTFCGVTTDRWAASVSSRASTTNSQIRPVKFNQRSTTTTTAATSSVLNTVLKKQSSASAKSVPTLYQYSIITQSVFSQHTVSTKPSSLSQYPTNIKLNQRSTLPAKKRIIHRQRAKYMYYNIQHVVEVFS